MGIGDWIMATSQVRTLHEKHSKSVLVVGRYGRHMWSEVFDNNPRITHTLHRGTPTLVNGPGCRPYIEAKLVDRWVWKKWDIAPGEIYLTDDEKAFAEPYRGGVLIEPHTKVANGNKAWPFERWQRVVDSFPHRFTQVGNSLAKPLNGVTFVETTFRQAAAILSVCKAFVGSEGALHHAAAAFSVPAVVLFSEFISPEITGYPAHRNLRHAGACCGLRTSCPTCYESMQAISTEEVITNLQEILQ